MSFGEEGGDFLVGEASDATTYTSYQEREVGTGFGEFDEFIYIGFDGINTAMHGGYAQRYKKNDTYVETLQKMRKYGSIYKILVNFLPDSAVLISGKYNIGTMVH